MSANPSNGNGLARFKSWLGIIVGGSLLSMVVSFGTAKLKQGADLQRLATLEAEVKELKERRDRNEQIYATKEFVTLSLVPIIQAQRGQTDTLQEILNNVRRNSR